VIIELFVRAYTRLRGLTPTQLLEKIDNLGQQYILPDGSPMFSVHKEDYSLLFADEQNENKLKQFIMNSRHIMYHSLSAKEHLNWIEYVIWSFIRNLKDKYGCKIIIAIHQDEDSRINCVINNQAKERYENLFQQLSVIARKLLGEDIRIVDEASAREKKSRFYANHYHNIFVNRTIASIKAMASGKVSFNELMRQISYVESTFPVMILSKNRGKFSRLYVIDRVHALNVWNNPPLMQYKESHNIFFIYFQTLTLPSGEPIRIFNPDDTVNITDSIEDVQKKLVKLDTQTKLIMLYLLSACSNAPGEINNVSECQISDRIIDLVIDAKSKYSL
jgi:hypothetical protein